MPKWIVDAPSGKQELIETGAGGSYFDTDLIVWCWDGDGEPPVKVDLGFMERIEKVEPIKDVNGKPLYDIIVKGPNKADRVKAPQRQLVTYLRNKKLNKTAVSKRPPSRLEPEA